MIQTIEGGDKRYLSELPEFKNGLPHGVVNKTKTDVGGTFVAANCEKDYIIVCPFRDLVESIEADPNNRFRIFKCYGGTKELDYIKYKRENSIQKIAVTYDSLPKLISWIGNPKNFFLLIDEYHLILEDMDFRTNAINNMMRMVEKFNHYTFLSATPTDQNFEIEQFYDLPHYEIHWDTFSTIKPLRYKTTQVSSGLAQFIKIFLRDGITLPSIEGDMKNVESLFIFINSVTTIEQICRSLDLSQDDVKICCADRQRNRLLLNKYQIESVSNPNKKINFFTKKCFQGCNLKTNNGLIIVGSDGRREQTLIDISTTLEQIAGRIRFSDDSQNIFRHLLVHIYSTNNHSLSDDEFSQLLKDKENEANKLISGFNKMDIEEQMAYGKGFRWETTLLSYDDGKLTFNELKKQNFIYKQHLRNVYKDGFAIRNAYRISRKFEKTSQLILDKFDVVMKQALTIGYQDLIKDYYNNPSEQYEIEYPEFKCYLKYLTLSEIHSLGFNKDKLLKSVEDKKQLEDVFRSIYRKGFVSSKELKQILKDEFEKRGMKISPKATLIEGCNLYEVKKSNPYIDGKRTTGYILGSLKFDFRL